MKLRIEYLKALEPNDWEVGDRKGTTYKILVLTEDGSLPFKVTDKFYNAIVAAKFPRLSVVDIEFSAQAALQLNANGRPEQVLKLVPIGFELVELPEHLVKSSAPLSPVSEKKSAGA